MVQVEVVKPLVDPKKYDVVHHEHAKQLNNKVDDAMTFLASISEGGQFSQGKRDHEECENFLNGVKARVLKAVALINELRAMGHDLADEYVAD
nr:hypothetical protein [Tanacetum cinerariifolium]